MRMRTLHGQYVNMIPPESLRLAAQLLEDGHRGADANGGALDLEEVLTNLVVSREIIASVLVDLGKMMDRLDAAGVDASPPNKGPTS
jgi:hypothetical protein